MKEFFLTLAILIAAQNETLTLFSPPANKFGTQEAAEKRDTRAPAVIGEVVNVDRDAREATLKTDRGAIVMVKVANNTICLRLLAGETTLDRAESVQCADIEVGDRVLGRGLLSDDKRQLQADRLIVVSKANIDKKRERDLDQWRRRGIVGLVKEVNAQTGEINLEVRGPRGVSLVSITTEKCTFRRYASGSASFRDAKPSSRNTLKVGDQLRALGDRSADGKTFMAEVIVSGSFQTLGCVVTEIDSPRNEIKAQTLDRKQTIVVSMGKDLAVHRIPPELAIVIAKAVLGSRSGNTATGAKQAEQNVARSPSGQKAPGNVAADQPLDLPRLTDGLPSLTLADIKKGDVLAVVGAIEGDKSRVTAIKLFAGVDAILNALKPPSGKRQTVALSAGLPPGVFDFTLGPP